MYVFPSEQRLFRPNSRLERRRKATKEYPLAAIAADKVHDGEEEEEEDDE